MRAALALASCAVGLGGCTTLDGMGFGGERRLDPAMVYLASFEQVETTQEDVEQYACLSGSPIICDILGITLVECWCPY